MTGVQTCALPICIDRAFSELESSLLLRVQANRIVAHYERGFSALAAAEALPRKKAKLLAIAEKDALVIAAERMAWAEPFAELIRAGIAAQRGEKASATLALGRAESGFSMADMHLYAASARRRRGELAGGEDGLRLAESADQRMRAEGIEHPARWAAMLAPGFACESSLESGLRSI